MVMAYRVLLHWGKGPPLINCNGTSSLSRNRGNLLHQVKHHDGPNKRLKVTSVYA